MAPPFFDESVISLHTYYPGTPVGPREKVTPPSPPTTSFEVLLRVQIHSVSLETQIIDSWVGQMCLNDPNSTVICC